MKIENETDVNIAKKNTSDCQQFLFPPGPVPVMWLNESVCKRLDHWIIEISSLVHIVFTFAACINL